MEEAAATSNELKDESAGNLLDGVENGIWHAFDFLALEGDGTAPKSKLKVGVETKFKKAESLYYSGQKNGSVVVVLVVFLQLMVLS